MCGEIGAEVPGHRIEQLAQTLIVRLLKMHLLVFTHELVTRPAGLFLHFSLSSNIALRAALTAPQLHSSTPF